MGVVRVVCELDCTQIIFGRSEDGSWVASIPPDFSGEYIIEVRAYDEAGNEAYSTQMLFVVDVKTLAVKMIPFNYSTSVIEAHNEDNKLNEFVYIEIENGLEFRLVPQNFSNGGEWVK
jgi:hypothetical protein